MCTLRAAENRQVSDTEYRQFTDNIIDKLMDAERVTTLILKDIASTATTTSSSGAASGNAAALAAAAAAAAEQAELMNANLRRQQWLAVAGKTCSCGQRLADLVAVAFIGRMPYSSAGNMHDLAVGLLLPLPLLVSLNHKLMATCALLQSKTTSWLMLRQRSCVSG